MYILKLCIIAVTLILLGCGKDAPIELTEHKEKEVICEGYFTDQPDSATFNFSLSSNLGETVGSIPSGITMYVTTPTGTINFSETDPGYFRSDVPFTGEPGMNYSVCFTYNSMEHCAFTKMPQPITIDSLVFDSIPEGGSTPTPIIKVYLDNITPNQYMKFELFTGDTTEIVGDTVWTQAILPLYRVVKLPVGMDVNVTLPISPVDFFSVDSTSLVKVKTILLSADIGAYLKEMADYINSQLSNGQYYNPPYFYSNEGYGLAYGTQIDSVIYQY